MYTFIFLQNETNIISFKTPMSLIKKPILPIARQNRARCEVQAESQGEGWSQGDAAATREARCEVASHEPCGKI